uniref:Uncharacterized protein n=1 Tax=Anguilla anguilla TaxID=7936 RepID=A0A0E9S475_ANGAN
MPPSWFLSKHGKSQSQFTEFQIPNTFSPTKQRFPF